MSCHRRGTLHTSASRGMAIIMVLIATFLVVEVLVLALHIAKDNDNLSVFDVSIFTRPSSHFNSRSGRVKIPYLRFIATSPS